MFAILEECFILAEKTQLAGIAFAQIRKTLAVTLLERPTNNLNMIFHMTVLIVIENKLSYSNSHDSFIGFLFFIVIVVILSIYKARRNKSEIEFEQKIINTISSNRIIDPAFFIGLSEKDLKEAITQEILKINRNWKFKKKFIDLPKMTLLMEKLEFENLQKLYQWFFYKG